jgi:hypothetical protein
MFFPLPFLLEFHSFLPFILTHILTPYLLINGKLELVSKRANMQKLVSRMPDSLKIHAIILKTDSFVRDKGGIHKWEKAYRVIFLNWGDRF